MMGQGPGTGRGLGYCTGSDSPGYTRGASGGSGRGFGFRGGRFGNGRGSGWGRRFGFRHRFGSDFLDSDTWSPGMSRLTKEDEVKMLKLRAEELSRSQKEIEQRLGDLEKQK